MASVGKIERGLLERLGRLSRLKLIIPLRRSPHSPEYSARGVAVGMFWAMTPLVGIQMYLCLMTWLAAKPFRHTHFSLVIACAWTWVTNVFTMLPTYYVFYVTGQLMLGKWNDISGYGTFLDSWHEAFSGNHGFWHSTLQLVEMLAKELGISMALGCLPYAIGGAAISYYLALKYTQGRRKRMVEKRTRAAIDEGRAVPSTQRPSA